MPGIGDVTWMGGRSGNGGSPGIGGDPSSATYTTCSWLWQNVRFSVFWAKLPCIRHTLDFCDNHTATIAA